MVPTCSSSAVPQAEDSGWDGEDRAGGHGGTDSHLQASHGMTPHLVNHKHLRDARRMKEDGIDLAVLSLCS